MISPFRLDVPQADLDDLRRRLHDTRWPDPETVGDWSQGVPPDYVRELCRYVDALGDSEQAALADRAEFQRTGTGYSRQQSTRPQTLGYGLADSPAGQAAWIVEKFRESTGCPAPPPRRRGCTGRATATSRRTRYTSPPAPRSSPRRSTGSRSAGSNGRFTDLRYFSQPESGGHFASMEQPQVFVDELRAFLRTVRPA